jgi:hypothetical protein
VLLLYHSARQKDTLGLSLPCRKNECAITLRHDAFGKQTTTDDARALSGLQNPCMQIMSSKSHARPKYRRYFGPFSKEKTWDSSPAPMLTTCYFCPFHFEYAVAVDILPQISCYLTYPSHILRTLDGRGPSRGSPTQARCCPSSSSYPVTVCCRLSVIAAGPCRTVFTRKRTSGSDWSGEIFHRPAFCYLKSSQQLSRRP